VTDLRTEPTGSEVFMFTADGNQTDFTGFVL
jgi:hypothetical protein